MPILDERLNGILVQLCIERKSSFGLKPFDLSYAIIVHVKWGGACFAHSYSFDQNFRCCSVSLSECIMKKKQTKNKANKQFVTFSIAVVVVVLVSAFITQWFRVMRTSE